MRFTTSHELRLFGDSVRGELRGWQAPLEPELGDWWDDRDDELAARLERVGWGTLWGDLELRAAAVAGAIELGRVIAPLSLLDEATLGAPLCVDGRGRHASGSDRVAVASAGGGLTLAPWEGGAREPTLDGTGTMCEITSRPGDEVADAGDRWCAWVAATLGYLAGIARASLESAVAHARSREQFGAPLASLAAVQARLADGVTACDGIELCAWDATGYDRGGEGTPRWDELAWAGGTAREVTAASLQVHGAIGFALEGGVHRLFRRAKVVQVWADACRRLQLV